MKDNWNNNLTPEQNYILKNEGTEPPGSSHLNQEKRKGDYHCAGCGTKLFSSDMKYESGSGWPSFFSSLPEFLKLKLIHISVMKEPNIIVKNAVVTMDIFLRTAQNLPFGKRFCNNGLCLIFKPKNLVNILKIIEIFIKMIKPFFSKM